MTNTVLNIISLGTKPLYEKQRAFHDLISEFRHRFSNPQRAAKALEDINEFYEKLDNFNFNHVFFKDYYRNYIENLNLFRPIDNNPDLTFLRIALTENKWKPTRHFNVFVYHLRYKYKLTSKFFVSHQKKQNHKKLNTTGDGAKQESKFDPSKKWTRVPMRQNQCKPGCGCSK